VHAKYAVRLLFDDELDLALSVQVRLGARIGEEGEAADPVPHTILLQILLRLADPRHLRVRVHHARNSVVVNVAVARVDVLCRGDAFLLRFVREHGPEGNVADALDVRHTRVKLVVDHDAPARIDFDTSVFEAKAFGVWPTADGDEDDIGVELWI
jgi:hypothetical protein